MGAVVELPRGPDLLVNKDGNPRPVLENIVRCLAAGEWEGCIAFDELAVRAVVMKATPAHDGVEDGRFPRPWGDADDALTAAWLQRTMALFVKPSQIPDAVLAVSSRNKIHPVRDYLDGLKWDKQPRLDLWLTKYLGAEDSPLIRAISSKTLIGAIARVRKPGAKVDQMIIFEGPQGSLKSTALSSLMPAPGLFTDDLGDALGKEAAERLAGKWLVEVAELDAMSKAEASRTKSFVSRQVDHYRPSYGRHAQDFPRQCFFAGTTNQEHYLKDETGGRRFWPVRVGTIDIPGLRAARDQIWAETQARYDARERWWLEGDLIGAAQEAQRDRFEEDVWHERIKLFLVGHEEVTIPEVLDHLKIETARQGQPEQKRVGKTLRALGWTRDGQVRKCDGSRPRIYRPSQVAHVAHAGANE